MWLRGRVLSSLILFSVASVQAQTSAQTPSPVPTFKTKSHLVLVDVVVTNNKNESVTGLKKQDFEVLEDGKRQTIAMFEEHQAASPTHIDLPPMPPGVYTNFPTAQSSGLVNVLLLDGLNTPTNDQAYVHAQMIKCLKNIPPQTRVAIFTLASRLRMLQGITTDSAELLAILNNAKAGPQPSALRASTVESDSDQSRIAFLTAEGGQASSTNQSLAQAAVDPINATRQFLSDTAAFQTQMRTAMTLEALQQLARYLSSIPGRKNVIWFSGSFPAGIVPNPDLPDPFNSASEMQQEVRKTTDLLSSAQVAIYPIAAEGLASDTAFQVDNREISEKRGSMAMQDTMQQLHDASLDRDFSHSAMEQIAKDTGGQAYYNSHGLSDALARVVRNGTHYYSLAYAPTDAHMDGKFRRIQLKLLHGNEVLSYRRGYYADDLSSIRSDEQKPDSNPLLPLMARNLPNYAQILYKILVKPATPQPGSNAPRAGSNPDMKGPAIRYGVDFAVAADDLKLDVATDGSRHGNLEIMLVAYDPEGKPLNLVVAKGEMRVQPKEYAAAQKGGLQIHKEIDLPAGNIYLRTGIYDLESGKAGTLGAPLQVAAAKTAK